MNKLLIATTNPGKLHEFSLLLKDLLVQLVSLKDVGITQDVEEDGKTYEENSKKKALFYATLSGLPAIADDGGLEIAALNNAPGIKSRRWLGYDATDEVLIVHLKKVVRQLPENNRNASFVTVVTLGLPDGRFWSAQGNVKGIVVEEPSRVLIKGYPYRSFFYLPKIKKFYHETELTTEEMKEYNHRYKAVRELRQAISKQLHVHA